MENGKAFHCAILEPRFADEYFVFDDSAKCAELVVTGRSRPGLPLSIRRGRQNWRKFEGKIEVSQMIMRIF